VEDLLTRWGVGSYSELLRVLNRRQTIQLVGVSEKTWERLEAVGDVPIKTQLSQGRVGHRLDHIKQWLDARRPRASLRASRGVTSAARGRS
jgi:predicted DNA-binding transcriptional regulator AlpA